MIDYCHRCIDKIEKLDVLFDLYQNVCEVYVLERKAFSVCKGPYLQFPLAALERKGFISSIEDDTGMIFVLPNGIYWDEEGYVFCPMLCNEAELHK